MLNKKKKSTIKQKQRMLENRATKFLKNRAKDREDLDDDLDEEEEDLTSSFKNNIKNLKSKDLTLEGRDIAVLQLMQQLVLDLLPIAEKNYRKFPLHTNASAVNSLISQERELEADIRALTSFKERAMMIVAIVEEEYKTITEKLVASTQTLQSRVKKSGNLQSEIKEFLLEQAKDLTSSRDQVGQKVLQMMVGSQNERKKSR